MKNPQNSSKKSSKIKNIKKSPSPDILHVPIPIKPSTYYSSNQDELNMQQILDYNTYKLLRAEFKLSHKGTILLRRCATNPNVPNELRRLPLLVLLTETAEEMMLNDLEIIVWDIYLKRFVWNEALIPFKAMLYITALAVKTYLNQSVQPFKAYLSAKFSNFYGVYNLWVEKTGNLLMIFPQELNSAFKALYKPVNSQSDEELIDYNYYVDDILEIAPPVVHKVNNIPMKETFIIAEPIREMPNIKEHIAQIEAHKDQTQHEKSNEEIIEPSQEPFGIILGKKDSIFCYPETPTLATSWSYMSNGSKSGQETSWFDNSDSDGKNQIVEKHEINDEELPPFHSQQSLFSAFWNSQTMGKNQIIEKNEVNDEELPEFTNQQSLFSSFWNAQPTE